HHDRTRRDRLALTAPRHDQPGTAGGRLLPPVLFPNPVPPAVAFCRRCFSQPGTAGGRLLPPVLFPGPALGTIPTRASAAKPASPHHPGPRPRPRPLAPAREQRERALTRPPTRP